MHAKLALGTVVGLFAWAPLALAKAPPVSLALEECPHLSTPEIERIFAAELGAASTTTANPGVTEVTIVCSGVHVLVRVKDPLSRKTVQRSFDTSTFDPRATPRLVALAASELVLASWAELYSNPTPAVEPEGPMPSANATMAALSALRERTQLGGVDVEPRPRPDPDEPDDRVLRVVALGSVRAFPGDSGALYGGGARLGEERFRLVAWALDTIIERGQVISRVGGQRIESTVTSATFGGSLLAYYSFKQVLTLRLGVGLRAGVVVANKPSIAPWGWPLGVTIWSVRVGSFVADVSGEAGYVAFPISQGGEVRGYWLSGQFGIGMVL